MRSGLLWLMLFIGVMDADRLRAQGGPPYFTNDPGTPGNRQWEVNAAYVPLTGDHTTTRSPDLDINFGWGERVQLTFEVAWLRDRVFPDPPRFGLSQDVLGVKWRFRGDEPNFAASIFPQLSINNPTRSVELGIVPAGASLTLPVELSKQFGSFAVNGELGYSIVQSGPNGWLAGVVAGQERRIRHRKSSLEFDAEFYTAGEIGGEVTQATVAAGLRIKVSPPFVLLAMAGKSVLHNGVSFTGYTGVQVLLPPRRFNSDYRTVTPAETRQ